MAGTSRWQRYVDSAVRPAGRSSSPEESAGATALSSRRTNRHHQRTPGGGLERLRTALAETSTGRPVDKKRRRGDLRLVPAAGTVWAVSAAGLWLNPIGLVLLGSAMSVCAGMLLATVWRRRKDGGPAPRSHLTTWAVALLLASAAAAHSAGASVHRHEGALAEAIAAGATARVELDVTDAPRRLPMPGKSAASDRWAATVTTRTVTSHGKVIIVQARLLVIGGEAWQYVRPGQGIRTTGKLRSPDHGRAEAGILSATSPPVVLGPHVPWEQGPGGLRELFRDSSRSLPGDAPGLLPGMVTGDTSQLDEQLSAAMKTVGMTHLTAVSGANCTLVLGALLLVARSLRLPRAASACLALGGLALFVLTVGPDASVLRAALMGGIGLVSLAGGRPGRGLSFLCLAVVGLLLAAPELGASYGFILSVLATLGIVTLGARLVEWTPHQMPRWAAAGLAVPLSAQLFCGPVIVLLQPQFSGYALIANIVASPLVGPVTILGTAAVPLLPFAPLPGVILVVVAGFFSNCVAGTARFFASLPGASLAWPEGIFGLSTMVLLSCLSILGTWLVFHPMAAGKKLMLVHGALVRYLDLLERLWRGWQAGLVAAADRSSFEPDTSTSGRSPLWLDRRQGRRKRRSRSWSRGAK